MTFLVEELHLKIAQVISEGPNTIRALEEMTNHYFRAKKWIGLKRTIASIETFLLLFNPYTKYDLCRYWQVLEGKNYDPVVEYNNGIEIFDMHFSPKAEDLFTIILQISRFLKEFSDFETRNTPKFRHPYIKGKIVDIKRVKEEPEDSTLKEYSNYDKIKSKREAKKLEEKDQTYDVLCFLKTNSKEAREFILEKEKRYPSAKDLPFENSDDVLEEVEKNKENNKRKGVMSYLDDIGLEREITYMKMTKGLVREPLVDHEKCNVDVPSGRVNFYLDKK